MIDHDIGMFLQPEYITSRLTYKGCGISDDDLSRPIIGIANSFTDMSLKPCAEGLTSSFLSVG